MTPTKWVIEDPERNIHHVELDAKGQWHGTENLTMTIADASVRAVVKHSLLRALINSNDDHGSWGHYTWIRQS